jgi:hypothetical protein
MRCCSSNTVLVGAGRAVPAEAAGALAAGAEVAGCPTVAVNAGTGVAAIGAMAVDGAGGLCATADVQAAVPTNVAIAAAMANPL